MTENFGSITYNRPYASVTQSTALEYETRVTKTADGKVKLELYVTLNPANVAQVSTVTLTAGSTGDDYIVVVTSGGVAKTYTRKMQASETATVLAADLATLIDTHPAVTATSAGGVITITANVPGTAFTAANTGSTTTGNVVVATTTANSGTALHRLVAAMEVATDVKVSDQGSFLFQKMNGTIYDGSAIPAAVKTWTLESPTVSKSLDTLQTEAGISRPTVS